MEGKQTYLESNFKLVNFDIMAIMFISAQPSVMLWIVQP